MADNEEEILEEDTSTKSNIRIELFGVQTVNLEDRTKALDVVSLNEDEDSTLKKEQEFKRDRRRMRQTSFQARMGRKLDRISRRLIDNEIRLTSSPVDMIRIKAKRDERSQDLISRTIVSAEVMPVVFQKIESIPLRHLKKEGEDIKVPSLYHFTTEQQYFEIFVPMAMHLDEDDLLFRIIFDEYSDRSYVMALQVKEILGNIGSSSLRMVKYWVTLYDEPIPDEIVNTIIKATNKREVLGW